MNYNLDAQQYELKNCYHYYSYSLFEVRRDLCRVKDSDKVYLNIIDIIEHEHEEEPFDSVSLMKYQDLSEPKRDEVIKAVSDIYKPDVFITSKTLCVSFYVLVEFHVIEGPMNKVISSSSEAFYTCGSSEISQETFDKHLTEAAESVIWTILHNFIDSSSYYKTKKELIDDVIEMIEVNYFSDYICHDLLKKKILFLLQWDKSETVWSYRLN